MDATMTTLHREIQHEERAVGMHPKTAVTGAMITKRQFQVALVLAFVVAALLGIAFMPKTAIQTPVLQGLTVALAVLLGMYGLEQDKHLRRLRALSRDEQKVTLAVAQAMAESGVLRFGDDELLALRESFRESADRLASGLQETIGAEFARVRVPGPAGEVPTRLARHTLRRGSAVLEHVDDGRSVLAVPIWFHSDAVAVLEAVSHPAYPFTLDDVETVAAFAAGAVAAMRV